MLSRRKFVALTTAFAASPALVRAQGKPSAPMFDTHLHFFTDDVDRYPLSGAPQARPRLLANPNTVEKVLAFMDQTGVEGCAGVQYRTAYGEDDSYLLDVASKHLDRIRPVIILDGKKADAPQKLEALVKRGAVGLRLTGPEEKDGSDPWLNSAPVLDLWKEANSLGTPVALMYQPVVMGTGNEDSLQRIAEIAGTYPKLKIVCDHAGFPVIKDANFGLSGMHATLKEHRNVYYKITTMNFDALGKASLGAPEFVRAVVDFYGADHVMWGSDFGNSVGTYPELVNRALAATAKLNSRERENVLHDTGRAVYGRA